MIHNIVQLLYSSALEIKSKNRDRCRSIPFSARKDNSISYLYTMTGWIDDSSVLKDIAYSDLRLRSYIRMYVYEIETARASNGEKWMHADLFLPLCSHATIMSTPWIGRTNTRFGFRNVSGILEERTEEGTWDGANRFRDRNETPPRMIDEFFISFLEASLFCMYFNFIILFFFLRWTGNTELL